MKQTFDYLCVAATDSMTISPFTTRHLPFSGRATFAQDDRGDIAAFERSGRKNYLPPLPEFKAYAQMCLSLCAATDRQSGGVTPSMYQAIGGGHRPYSFLDESPVAPIKAF